MNKETLVAHLSIDAHELEVWLEQAWLVPRQTDEDLRFRDADIARARLIQELKGPLGVNDPGVDLVLHLLDQLHGVRQALDGLRTHLREQPV